MKRLAAIMAAAAICMLMSGCSIGMDVEALLRPPRPTGEQKKIQQALESHIRKLHKESPELPGGYLLKYPKSGPYRSAFVIKDMDNDGRDEAIVLYSLGSEKGMVRLNLLTQSKDGWTSVSDVEGASADIDRIQFGDLDGDGTNEILTGWNIDNLSYRQLIMYSLADGVLNERYKELYSEFLVGRFTDSGRDSLMILHINPTDKVTTAKLLQTKAEKNTQVAILAELGTARLDGYISSFANPVMVPLSDTVNGVYADGIRSSGGMVTELIYWDGSQLRAPFYDREQNKNELTFRDAMLPSRDLNGDGTIEWPRTKPLAGYKNSAADKIWYTVWSSWNFEAEKVINEFSCVFNLTDGYYFLTDDEWEGQFTASYDKPAHTLSLHKISDGKIKDTFFKMRAQYKKTMVNEPQESGNEQEVFEVFEDLPNVRFLVKYTDEKPFNLNYDRISYRVTFIP
ncbi:MAG: VCBS repeat-containing protein [Clostridiales bacterium]|nr:VCBS repeat-containing protein [Clostridiales bacterium]